MDPSTHSPTSSPASTSSPHGKDVLLLVGGTSGGFFLLVVLVVLCRWQYNTSKELKNQQLENLKKSVKESPTVEKNLPVLPPFLLKSTKQKGSTVPKQDLQPGVVGHDRLKVNVKAASISNSQKSYHMGSPISVLTHSVYDYGQSTRVQSKRSHSMGSNRSQHSSGAFAEYVRKYMGSPRSLSSSGIDSYYAHVFSGGENSSSSTNNSIKDRQREAPAHGFQMRYAQSKDTSDLATNSRSPGRSTTNYLDISLPPIPKVIKPSHRYPSSSIVFGDGSSTQKSKPWYVNSSASTLHLKLPRRRHSESKHRRVQSDVQEGYWGESPGSQEKFQSWDPGPLPKRIHVNLSHPNVIVPSPTSPTPPSELYLGRLVTPVDNSSPPVTWKTPSRRTSVMCKRRDAGSDRMTSEDFSAGLSPKPPIFILPLASLVSIDSALSSPDDKPLNKASIDDSKESAASFSSSTEEENYNLAVPKAAVKLPAGLKIEIPARVISSELEVESTNIKAHSSFAFSSFSFTLPRSSTVESEDNSSESEQTSTTAVWESEGSNDLK